MLGPRDGRLLRVAGEWAVIEPFRFEKDDRIVVLDRGDQETFSVVGIGGDDGLEAGDVREQGLGTLAMRLPAIDAAAARHADHDRSEELAARAVAQPRRLRHDLVVAGIDIVGELDLGDHPKPIGAHADRHAHDSGFVDRRVEAARLAILALQPIGAAKHAAEIADVLTEHDDVLVLGHLAIHRVADRLDHRHARHGAKLRAAGAARADGAASTYRLARTSSPRSASVRRAGYRGSRPPWRRLGSRRRPRPASAGGAPRSRRRYERGEL